MSTLTELEGSVLGMIGVKGPCTPYALRREFMNSPSQYWSASSGAIYPLVLRLERRGLVHVQGKTGDGRAGSLYVLTAPGLRAVREWLATLNAPTSISVPPDPLRNRIAFFELLDPRKQQQLVGSAVREMQAHVARARSYTLQQRAQQHASEQLVSEGAERMLEARLVWLREVARVLRSPARQVAGREARH
jgi:DNA-binding PadR family transcriptional regulator